VKCIFVLILVLIIFKHTKYTRVGETGSMYEPHIVKPELQRAAT